MSVVNINQMPDATRLWIFACERGLNINEVNMLKSHMARFIEQWTAHKRELKTAWEVKYGQFILIAVDETQMAASGCSIDTLVRNIHDFEKLIGCQIVGTNTNVFYRDSNSLIKCVSRNDFKRSIEHKIVNQDTIVFNNTVQTIGEVKNGQWEVALKSSWHKRAFLE